MTTPTLDDLLDMGEHHARTVLLELKEESLQPFYHLSTLGDDQPDALIPCLFMGDETKNITVAVVTKVAREIDAYMVLFVSEAWMAVIPADPGHDPANPFSPQEFPGWTTPPSEHPDRVEIVAMVASDGTNVRQRSLKMIRDDTNKITALERTHDTVDVVGGRMIDGIIKPKTTH